MQGNQLSSSDHDASNSRALVVILSPFVPFEGIAHAGGQLCLKHVSSLLACGCSVRLLAPRNRVNLDAARRWEGSPGVVLYGDEGDSEPHLWPSIASGVALIRSAQARQMIRDADILEFQWEETLALLPLVRLLGGSAPRTCVVHDVSSQRVERKRDRKRRSLFTWLKVRAVVAFERRVANRCTLAFVLSEKDRVALSRNLRAPSIVVNYPPLYLCESLQTNDKGTRALQAFRPEVLFVAALSRQENREGLRWFVRYVWPAVLHQSSSARLVVVGSGAPSEFSREMDRVPQLDFLGFVEDLDSCYDRAAVCVVPVLSGAGVKFKTIEALVRGIPVVGTTLGFEGVEIPGLLDWRADSCSEFSDLVVEILGDPAAARRSPVFSIARSIYSAEEYTARLRSSYSSLLFRPMTGA